MVVQVSQSERGLVILATKNHNDIVKYGTAAQVAMLAVPQMLAAKPEQERPDMEVMAEKGGVGWRRRWRLCGWR